ncbi:MAG: BrnA antitoxin family protein [Chloroflexota bacterium]|nr:BrnA antitoxin family protein [Chloroflexota bacterium]
MNEISSLKAANEYTSSMDHGESVTGIPAFHNREEEAEFWDTHDVTDYLDELRPVQVRFAPNLSTGMTVRLDPDDRDALGRIAAERGVGPSTLVRMWIKERLRAESSS